MTRVLKDFVKGGVLVVAGIVFGCIALIVLFLLGLLFQVIGIFAVVLFFVFLFFFSIWLVGFLYRKIKEIKGKQ